MVQRTSAGHAAGTSTGSSDINTAHARNNTRGDVILVLNCGSSSIKFALFDACDEPLPREPLWRGKVQGIGGPTPGFEETGVQPFAVPLDAAQPYRSALALIRQRITDRLDGRRITVVAHRVVHGGCKYFAPVRLDDGVIADLRSYIPLAPLHQPFALEAMDILLREQPEVIQVACFDTAFHHTQPRIEQLLPLPHTAWERGLRRYGFHGLSYEYMAVALDERYGSLAHGRTIVAHLGSGASLCAMQGLRSVATTMGFSALDGLMMGTRPGTLDPGAVIYLMEIEKLSLEQVAHLLYNESGLLGVSGVSSEPRALLKLEAGNDAQAERARDALALYVRRIVREIGALVAVLGGLELLVFTAGVGEHSAEIRRRVCDALGFLGLRLDPQANLANAPCISAAGSQVVVGVEPTNEEWIAATHACPLAADSYALSGGPAEGDCRT
ncbi:acetate/propionate family kinase [Pusillimonas sp. TS35]|uniref:acetate/propionate family kinase n=1 Tax=Paracandidimonas lactea TaxID=2895524 RepID=UPI00136E06EA|nr:acetate/propionate family kinase [Paracandidimonas lactea]MYN15074.1 acetate/propionate family kinase [Pusillimonas sp. TS35]